MTSGNPGREARSLPLDGSLHSTASPFRTRPRPARRRRTTYAAIALGGAAGGLARYGLASAFPTRPGGFPWTTFGINVGGAFLLALLLVLVLEVLPAPPWLRPLLGTGFLGAFTTWSAFMLEVVTAADAGHVRLAVAYGASAMVAGLAAASFGMILGRSLVAARTVRRTRE